MHQKDLFAKPHYSNTWHLLAKLLSLLIYVYILLNLVSCAQKTFEPVSAPENQTQTSENAVNINTSTAEELEKLPRIGAELARRIIEHREKYGPFRHAEDLILVRGMSDKKFREIRNFVKVE